MRADGLRARWKTRMARYEWDYAHGTSEKYGSRGHHEGEFPIAVSS